MKNHYLILTIAMFFFTCSTACKKDKNENLPATKENDNSATGYIRGTASGTTLDGKPFSFPFNFKDIDLEEDNYYKVDGGHTIVKIEKETSLKNNEMPDGYAALYLVMDSITPSQVSVSSLEISLMKAMAPGDTLDIYKDYEPGFSDILDKVEVSNTTYDKTTGIFSGKFTASFVRDQESGTLTITDGFFSAKLEKK